VNVKWQNPEVSAIEGLWARGDRRLSGLLTLAYNKGCYFDGWSDHFNYRKWMEACGETNVDIDFYNLRRKSFSETLPWDHIDSGIKKEFLKKEMIRSLEGIKTSDCRREECNQCGVCDFKNIEPRIEKASIELGEKKVREITKKEYVSVEIIYEKMNMGRFYGHLEVINIFNRAFRRAGIEIQYSKGFHPKPKLSFMDPLPIGIESKCETLLITTEKTKGMENLKSMVNEQLPDGLKIVRCTKIEKIRKNENDEHHQYDIFLKKGRFDKEKAKSFHKMEKMLFEKKNKKGKIYSIDLKEVILHMEMLDPKRLKIKMKTVNGKKNKTI
jgi:radical SAM-linked protein